MEFAGLLPSGSFSFRTEPTFDDRLLQFQIIDLNAIIASPA